MSLSLSRGGLSQDRLGSSWRCRDGPFRAAEAGATQELGNTNAGAASQGENSPHSDIHHSTSGVHHFLGGVCGFASVSLDLPPAMDETLVPVT